MKRFACGVCVLLGVATYGAMFTSASAADPASPPPGYKLVWSDEFDYQGLPDPAKWDYEEGYVRNNEAQFYTRARQENARVENGVLVIEARKEHFKKPQSNANRGNKASSKQSAEYAAYTAASLITLQRASWEYGRIEVRAKLPQGKGVWPAIWMLGDNITKIGWPACGEIDIMEFVGHTPNKVHATVHYRKDDQHKSSGGQLTVTEPWVDFHVYAVEWTPERMDFFFDENRYQSFDVKSADDRDQNPFRQPQYLLINLALGGSWGGKIDDSVLPQKYLIDYVRVYQKDTAQR
jgi:beta-glucanase (GH16 family)